MRKVTGASCKLKNISFSYFRKSETFGDIMHIFKMCAKQNEKIRPKTIQHNLKQRRALDLTKTWESHLASFFEEIQTSKDIYNYPFK